MANNEDIEELKKELKKLKPEDRLKKLKELEEKRKAEITDIEELIKNSKEDIKTDAVADEIAPEQTEVNIGKLFKEESEQLEGTVKKEAPKTEEDKDTAFKQLYTDYTALQEMAQASTYGALTSEQEEVVDQIGERLDKTKYQSASDEVANILVASRSVLYKIKKYAGLK